MIPEKMNDSNLLSEITNLHREIERFKYIINENPAVTYIRRPDGNYGITFVSGNATSMLGYLPLDFTGDPGFWTSRMHPHDRERVLAEMENLFTSGRHLNLYRFRHKNGAWRWMVDECRLMRDADGTPSEIIGFWTDITEKKTVEDSLRESSEKFRQIVENIEEVFFIIDLDANRLIYISPAYEKIWCRSCRSAYEGDAGFWINAIHSLDRDSHLKKLGAHMRDRETRPYRDEFRIQTPDGSVRWIQAKMVPVQNDLGEIKRLAGIASDITILKNMEMDLRISNERFQQIADTAAIMIWEVDHSGKVTYVNSATEKITGFRPSEVIGRMNFMDFIRAEDKNEVSVLYRLIYDEKKTILNREINCLNKAGDTIFLSISIVPVVNEESRVTSLRGSAIEIRPNKMA
jgi:PAS domain S-box-containing protein